MSGPRDADPDDECSWCDGFHKGPCPAVSAMEFYKDGELRRVEFTHAVPRTQTIGDISTQVVGNA